MSAFDFRGDNSLLIQYKQCYLKTPSDAVLFFSSKYPPNQGVESIMMLSLNYESLHAVMFVILPHSGASHLYFYVGEITITLRNTN